MFVVNSKNRCSKLKDSEIADLLRAVSTVRLREYVDRIAFPRHYVHEHTENVRARDLLLSYLRSFGYTPRLQGAYDNIVADSDPDGEDCELLLGAHYDSIPGCPGADDNGSAIALCLECANLIKQHDLGSVRIVFFNREEDGLLGSQEFVANLADQLDHTIQEAHIFEMVGYCSHAPKSQRMPPGLPGVIAPDVGDFLALLANRHSNRIAEQLLSMAATYVTGFPVLALKMYLGVEKYFGHLLRSDHAPFWNAGIPAIMWTDTSEFRNSNYHRITDTPATLDYDFLMKVTQVMLARVATRNQN